MECRGVKGQGEVPPLAWDGTSFSRRRSRASG